MRVTKNNLRVLANDFFSSGISEDYDSEIRRKIVLLNIIGLGGIINLLPLGVLAYYQGNFLLGLFDHILAVILVIHISYLRISKNHKFVSYSGVAFTGILFVFLFVTGGVNNTGHYWYYTFPLFAFFLLGSKRGAIASSTALLIAILFLTIKVRSPALTTYSTDFALRFIPSFIVVFAYSYFYERIREQAQERLYEKNFHLEKTVKDLNKTQWQLKRERDNAQRYLNIAGSIIVAINVDGEVFLINAKGCDVLGYEEAEIIGKDWIEYFLSPESREKAKPSFAKCMAGDTEIREYLEDVVVTRNGEERLIAWHHAIITNEAGDIAGILSSGEDITERVKAEEAAKAASKAKSEFLANMSHEIRTPMNGVLGMAELLLDSGLTEKQRSFTETLRESGEALLRIINDVLDFSKLEAGKMELETADFNVYKLVEGGVDLFAEQAHRKGLELACMVSNEIAPGLHGDFGRLRQVLSNLIGNAVKFTERGEVVVSVDPLEEQTEWTLLRFEVRDTGIGIASKDQKIIFDSFTQTDSTTGAKFGGTGLGLAIAKQFINLMGGEIGIVSEEGKGSTFWFSVRLEKPSDTIQDLPTARCELNGVRVLSADRNVTNRKIIHQYLASWGMRSESAQTGEETLEMLRDAFSVDDPYDLVIFDMGMTVTEGMGLLQAIKANPASAKARLVMLTSVAYQDDDQSAQEVEGSVCLRKPISRSRLYECINDVMTLAPDGSITAPYEAAPSAKTEFHARILLAEDNPVNQMVEAEMLEGFGCWVDIANNGKEALERTAPTQYDLIFMDCQMPEMDGYEATRLMKERRAKGDDPSSAPIIALTAHAVKGDREKCLAAGMDDYLSKPFSQDQLRDILRRWLPHKAAKPKR